MAPQEGVTDRRQALELSEALRSGNPPFASTLDWNDYDHLGLAGPQEIEGAIVAALEAIGGYRPIYAAGLSGPMGDLGDPDLSERVLQARAAFRLQLKGGALAGLIESFDAFRYNNTATIAENLLFGHPIGNRFSQEQIGADPFIHAILDAESLTQPLVQIGAKIAENVAAILPSASAGAPALARYPFVPTSDPELLQRIMVDGTSRTGSAARQAARSTLIGFALNYVEPRHRLGLINTDFQLRVLRARQSFRTHLAAQAQNSIAFYDRATLMTLASLRENILFGRLAHGAMASAEAVDGLLDQVIQDHGLTGLVLHLGLKREAGPGGRLLSPDQRTMIALARSVLARPEMLVLDMTLNALPQAEQSETLRRLRRVFTGRSLVATFLHEDDAAGFDRVLVFDGARLVKDRPGKLIEPGERVAAG
jgi:putative ABC transport system ATP-binding protein